MVTLGVRGLRVGYDRGTVLDDLTVDLTGGTRWVVLGANGSGKTTLLSVLSGALRPTAGQVLRNGQPLSYRPRALAEHRRVVQMVLQDPDDQLFSADVAADISFGPLNLGLSPDDALARVDEACALLTLDHLRDRPVHQLSGGERKRVAIAGAVAMRPQVLLLDEPTAGLDPEGIDDMLGVLDRLEEQGTTVVMATHDVDLALAWSTRALVVGGGTARVGDTTEILSDTSVISAARLRRPWPLELTARLIDAGLLPADGQAPRTMADVVALLDDR